ncbi:restriction endonuclease subunit S [Fructilactobacillus sanfranciscensis]|uniref:restriction endonuclease subunit S n=1 Tax=Fructilactobacillus sanfranciscensis TaxID=1625 RepID=UPI003BAD1095
MTSQNRRLTMKDNQAKYPQLRFKGFTDPWEERKLGDILSERNDQMPETNEYPLMSFVQGKGVTPKGERYNRSFLVKDSEKKYKKTELGDFIYSSNNLETGSIGFNKTGKAVISPVYSIFKSKKSQESQFIGIMSARKDFISKMVRFRQGVVYGQWRIHESDFLNIDMKIPNDKEQQLIISFFENIDKTIALHQRKLAKLKELKQGYLQKMFPKNGSKFPQLRFAGFADAWEERKSKEIFKAKVRKGEPNLPVLSVTQTSGVVYRGEVGIDIKYDVSTLKNYKVIEPNDFVISLRSFQGGFELSDKLGITSPAYTIFVPKYPEEQNNLFWRIQFKRFQFIESLKTVTFGIRDGKSISFNEFGDLKIKFPSNILEQQKIGTFFKQLDDTIALHQRKLDLLKEQKKGYLQKMFV